MKSPTKPLREKRTSLRAGVTAAAVVQIQRATESTAQSHLDLDLLFLLDLKVC